MNMLVIAIYRKIISIIINHKIFISDINYSQLIIVIFITKLLLGNNKNKINISVEEFNEACNIIIIDLFYILC